MAMHEHETAGDRLRVRPGYLTAFLAVLLLGGCVGDSGPGRSGGPSRDGGSPGDGRPLLIAGGTVVVMDDAGTVLEGGAVLVQGDRIAALLEPGAPRP